MMNPTVKVCVSVPAVEGHDHDDHLDVGTEKREDRERQDDERKRGCKVDADVDEIVNDAAEARGQKAQSRTENGADQCAADGQDKG